MNRITAIIQKRKMLHFVSVISLLVSLFLLSNSALGGKKILGCCQYPPPPQGSGGCADVPDLGEPKNTWMIRCCMGMCTNGTFTYDQVCIKGQCVNPPAGCDTTLPQQNQKSSYKTTLPIPSDSVLTFVLDASVPHSIMINLPDELGGGQVQINTFECSFTVRLRHTEFPNILCLRLLNMTASAPSFSIHGQETGANHMSIDTCCQLGYYDVSTDSLVISYWGTITNDLFAPDTIFVMGFAVGAFDESGPDGILSLETHSVDIYPFSPCFGARIPTLTEWGLIIFGVVLLGFITYVFLRRRKAAVSLR
jgi:hypothetical protein